MHFDTKSALSALSDTQLAICARNGDSQAFEYLLSKYKKIVKAKARSYFLIGADREDLLQEGMIGLYKAVRDFREDRRSSFKVFAELCVTRQIITAVKTATRQKHMPLNSYISLSRSDGDIDVADFFQANPAEDPVNLVISREEARAKSRSFYEILSDFETQVLRLYVEGKSYQEIARILRRRVKSVDNALQRLKKKIDIHLRSERLGWD